MDKIIIDIDPFLLPITEESPAGICMRYEDAYDAMRDALKEEPNLPQGVWVTELKTSDWDKVITIGSQLLTEKSKDLQVAAWLTEAWMRKHGLYGLGQGLMLLKGLTEKYWEDAYPKIGKDGDLEFRYAPYIWANDKLSQKTKAIKITNPTSQSRPYTLENWIDLTQLKDLYPGNETSGKKLIDQVGSNKNPTLLDLEKSMRETPSCFYQECLKQAQEVISICEEIDKFLEEKGQDQMDCPSMYKMISVMREFIRFATYAISVKKKDTTKIPLETTQDQGENSTPDLDSAPQDVSLDNSIMPSTDAEMTSSEGQEKDSKTSFLKSIFSKDKPNVIKNKQEAYALMRIAIEYLEKEDRHSPVPFLMQKALSLKDLTFSEIMDQYFKDPNMAAAMSKLMVMDSKE